MSEVSDSLKVGSSSWQKRLAEVEKSRQDHLGAAFVAAYSAVRSGLSRVSIVRSSSSDVGQESIERKPHFQNVFSDSYIQSFEELPEGEYWAVSYYDGRSFQQIPPHIRLVGWEEAGKLAQDFKDCPDHVCEAESFLNWVSRKLMKFSSELESERLVIEKEIEAVFASSGLERSSSAFELDDLLPEELRLKRTSFIDRQYEHGRVEVNLGARAFSLIEDYNLKLLESAQLRDRIRTVFKREYKSAMDREDLASVQVIRNLRGPVRELVNECLMDEVELARALASAFEAGRHFERLESWNSREKALADARRSEGPRGGFSEEDKLLRETLIRWDRSKGKPTPIRVMRECGWKRVNIGKGQGNVDFGGGRLKSFGAFQKWVTRLRRELGLVD